MILHTHPEVAGRDCQSCIKHVYNEETGELRRQEHGARLPVLRPPGSLPPCRVKLLGCANGSPEAPRSLSPKNLMAWHHYLECKATGIWPQDGIVKRNAGIIEAALRRVEILWRCTQKKHQHDLQEMLLAALKARTI